MLKRHGAFLRHRAPIETHKKLYLLQAFVLITCSILMFVGQHAYYKYFAQNPARISSSKSAEAAIENLLTKHISTSSIALIHDDLTCVSKPEFDTMKTELASLLSVAQNQSQNGTDCPPVPTPEEEAGLVWDYILVLKILATAGLLALSGLFSGLTLGLLGLDKTSLNIVATSGSPKEQVYARRIMPVRQRGNMLLCTLLIANVMVNSGISILTSDLTSGIWGFILSSAFITIFGEIAPQAICSRYALIIGAHSVWLIYILMVVLGIIAFPLSLILDKILGAEMGTIYSKNQLKELVNIHGKHAEESGLDQHEVRILGGVLEFANKTLKDIMTPVADAFMLEVSEKLDVDTMTKIWERGHSRIPVYQINHDNIIGMLFTKDLVLINPDEELPISTVLTFYGREVLKLFSDTKLDEALKTFKSGRGHLAVVQDTAEPESGGDPFYKTLGLVTLEDVIEELIKDEIHDERDVQNANRMNLGIFGRKGRLQRLSPQQVVVIASYLTKAIPLFQILPEELLHKLLGNAAVVDLEPSQNLVYQKGHDADFFCVIMSGKIEVYSGVDNFVHDSGQWTYLGLRAITNPIFVPDFDAKVVKRTKILKITRAEFVALLSNKHDMPSFALPKVLEWVKMFSQPQVISISHRGSAKPIPSPQAEPAPPVLSVTTSGDNSLMLSENYNEPEENQKEELIKKSPSLYASIASKVKGSKAAKNNIGEDSIQIEIDQQL